MDPESPNPAPSAEDLFAAFVEQVEAGAAPDFDALCAEHPTLAAHLRRVHLRWRTMDRAFSALASGDAATRPERTSSSLNALLGRLGGDASRWHRYVLGPEVARGAMGRVVQARDPDLGREVALKVHRSDLPDARLQRRFVEEAQITAQLDHPGIVPIHELGTDAAGQPFFAMKLVRGRTLDEVLRLARDERGGWSRTRVLHVLLRVGEAIAYAHDKGVVHRDLKPGNVMVGDFGEVYVMDWGLAAVHGDAAGTDAGAAPKVETVRRQIADEDATSPLLTGVGDLVGTPAYMAPEQAADCDRTATAAVDVYALGAILYHLLSGHLPYATHDAPLPGRAELIARLRRGPPAELPGDVPAELRSICERAMARDPAARYPSMGAFTDDLRAFLDLRVVRAHATGTRARLAKWIARNRALAATAAALAFSLCAGIAVALALLIATDRARRTADETADRLADELEKSQYRNARQGLLLDDSHLAGDELWRQHLLGNMPRATHWSLLQLAARDPVVAIQPIRGEFDVALAPRADAVLVTGDDGTLLELAAGDLSIRRRLGAAGGPVLTTVIAVRGERQAITGDAAGEVAVWDLAEGRSVRSTVAHDGGVTASATAASGSSFATGGAGGDVLLWDDAFAVPRRVADCGRPVRSLALDAATGRLALGAQRGFVALTSIAGGARFEHRIGDRDVLAVAFTADGRELWAGCGEQIVVFDAENGVRRRVLLTGNGTCRAFAPEPDGAMLVGGWWRVDRFDAAGRREEPIALRGAWHLERDPAGDRLVAASRTQGIFLVDAERRDRRWFAREGGALALSGDGRFAFVRDGRHVVKVDVASGEIACRTPATSGGWLATDGAGTAVATVQDHGRGVSVHDGASGALRFELPGPDETAFNESCAFSPDGRELAVVVGTGIVERRDARTGDLLATHAVPGRRILRVRYAADSRHLLVLPRVTRSVLIVRCGDGETAEHSFAAEPDGDTSPLAAMALSDDGSRLATGTWSGRIRVRDLASGATRSFTAHAGVTWSLQFAAGDPDLLFVAGGSVGVNAWDLASGECCAAFLRDVAPVAQLHRSSDGRTLACYTQRGPVAIDLEYFERHVAGVLESRLAAADATSAIAPQREQELRAWAAAVRRRPWPRLAR